MALIDKIGLGLGLFTGFAMFFLIVLPRRIYSHYYIDLQRRKLGPVIGRLVFAVFILAIPYFYDLLLGLNNAFLSQCLELAIGLCAVLVLADVSWFVYQNYGPPSRPRRMRKRVAKVP
jgi:uncharacterized membrane protein YczE